MNNYAGYKKLVSKVLKVPEEDILPLQDVDLTIIDRAIMAIGNRYRSILLRRFGVYGEQRQTLREIAKSLEVSPEWVRQLEARALTKLRHPDRIGNFRLFSEAGLEMQARIEETPLLERRIEDLCISWLSARTFNAINATGVQTLGELADKTEREMLKIKNFGQKSLAELKSLLLMFGLCLASDEHCRR